MEILKHVEINGIKPELVLALIVVYHILSELGYDTVITSCTNGKHSTGSLHYTGYAVDLRTHFMDTWEQQRVKNMIQVALNNEFDVVLEETHLHIEFQPKQGIVTGKPV